MTATSHTRGIPIHVNDNGAWVYEDGVSIEEDRPCARCGRMPNPDGTDACLGHIPGAIGACCGHGLEKPYVVMEEQK